MLVLHSSSRCDVCLSEYSFETSSKRPHAIACGHIFCSACLWANFPHQCPLCRKSYQPNKIKKLHVDRPENIDDHKELDLLQRLAVSWDTPMDQLKELMDEIDFWLRDRSEETCVALRRARAALDRHQTLKDESVQYHQTIIDLQNNLEAEHNKLGLQAEVYHTKVEDMAKEISRLKLEIQYYHTQIYNHTRQQRNPLPRPPEPIPIDQIPTFEQAMSEVGGSSARFSELPLSPYAGSMSNYSESWSSSRRSGKMKSTERERSRLAIEYDYGIERESQPQSQLQLQGPSCSSTSQSQPHVLASHYVNPHIAGPSSTNLITYEHNSPLSPTEHPNYGTHTAFQSQLALGNASQALDVYSVTENFLKAYSTGLINGKEVALGRQMTEFDAIPAPGADSIHPSYREGNGEGSSRNIEYYYAPSHSRAQGREQEPFYETDAEEHPYNNYESRPYSATAGPSSHSNAYSHRRHNTVSSIVASGSSGVGYANDHSAFHLRSRSRASSRSSLNSTDGPQRESIVLAEVAHFTHPGLAEVLATSTSNSTVRSPRHGQSAASREPLSPRSVAQTSAGLDITPNGSMNVNEPAPTFAIRRREHSPSARTHTTVISNSSTWATESLSLASGLTRHSASSLGLGLINFSVNDRARSSQSRSESVPGQYIVPDSADDEDEQRERHRERERRRQSQNSDALMSVRTRQSFSSEAASSEAAHLSSSPVRGVTTMPGVLPGDEGVVEGAERPSSSSYNYHSTSTSQSHFLREREREEARSRASSRSHNSRGENTNGIEREIPSSSYYSVPAPAPVSAPVTRDDFSRPSSYHPDNNRDNDTYNRHQVSTTAMPSYHPSAVSSRTNSSGWGTANSQSQPRSHRSLSNNNSGYQTDAAVSSTSHRRRDRERERARESSDYPYPASSSQPVSRSDDRATTNRSQTSMDMRAPSAYDYSNSGWASFVHNYSGSPQMHTHAEAHATQPPSSSRSRRSQDLHYHQPPNSVASPVTSAPRARRSTVNHVSLPEASPFDNMSYSLISSPRSSAAGSARSPAARQSFGNALGLDLLVTGHGDAVTAPIPLASSRSYSNSWNQEH